MWENLFNIWAVFQFMGSHPDMGSLPISKKRELGLE